MSWTPWKKKSAPIAVKIQVVRRSSMTLRLHEFRADKELVGLARKVLADPNFRLMLDVMHNEHPAFVVLPDDSQPHTRLAYQGKAEGYSMALANLEAMGKFEEIKRMPEPDFSPEEINQNQE